MASSINDVNASYDTSTFILCNGRKSTLPQVLLLGRTSFQNWMVGLGLKPRGGTSLAHVANIKMSFNFTSPPDPLLSLGTKKRIKLFINVTPCKLRSYSIHVHKYSMFHVKYFRYSYFWIFKIFLVL